MAGAALRFICTVTLAAAGACLLHARLHAQGGDLFRNEVRAPLSLQALGDETTQYSAAIEYNRYFSGRIHDERRRTLFGEAVGNPSSSIHFALIHQPNSDINVMNSSYGARLGYVQLIDDIGVGGSLRYNRILPVDSDTRVDDYEIGPELAFWPGDRLYITDALHYRKIGRYRNARLGFNASEEDFVQIRHHLVYAVAEDWSFTYTHDINLLVGIHQNFHTNNFTMDNYFMFSPSTHFSYGGTAGFKLEYRLGSRTSVLTIPVRGRVEYYLSNLFLLYGEAGYNIPTMLGQREGRLNVAASLAYRF